MHHRPLAMATARMCNSTAISIALVALLLTTTADAANHVSIREDTGWIATAIYPEITGSTKVDQLAREKAADITHKDQHDFIVWAKGDVKANGKPDSQYAYQSTPTITIDTPKLVSVLWTNESDIGGEHPTTAYDALAVGIVHGKPKVLTLADLFVDGVDATSISAQAVVAELMKDPDATDVQAGRVTALTPGLIDKFALGETAITFTLGNDVVNQYALDGARIVKVPYTTLADLNPYGPLKPLLKH